MKILLTAVNAKYIHSNLAVYSLRAFALANLPDGAADISIAEYTINHRVDDILEGIYKAEPDVLCFSCYIWNIGYVEELVREYHKLCPKVPIWLGGPEVSYDAGVFLKEHKEVTGVMIGEGEKTFLELCAYYADMAARMLPDGLSAGWKADRRKQPSGIHGIAYRQFFSEPGGMGDAGMEREDGAVIFTEPRAPLDMSAIPFCYKDAGDFKNRIIYYESSRGCPFHCSYCLSSIERTLRFRSPALVKEELAFFLKHGVPQVKFVDRTFNCRHDHAMEIWRFIRDHDNGITNFHFEISADLLTEPEIKLLGEMRPGLVQLEIGVQSTNSETITEIHRTMDLSRLKTVVKAIQAGRNIHQHLDLIAGLPYEDYHTFAKSFDEIYALRPDQLQLGFLKVLKGSYMHLHARDYGIVYHSRPPYEVLRTDWLDFSKILRIRQAEEMLEVYYNSGQFTKSIEILETQFDSPFFMYRRMGRFYEEKGYFGMSHARVRRSEILLEFAGQEAAECVPVLKESLIFDLYYREHMKSRPAWADDPREWKELERQYCRKGKQSHLERFSYDFLAIGNGGTGQDGLPVKQQNAQFVLFDYTKRDPFHHQALACAVDGRSSNGGS